MYFAYAVINSKKDIGELKWNRKYRCGLHLVNGKEK